MLGSGDHQYFRVGQQLAHRNGDALCSGAKIETEHVEVAQRGRYPRPWLARWWESKVEGLEHSRVQARRQLLLTPHRPPTLHRDAEPDRGGWENRGMSQSRRLSSRRTEAVVAIPTGDTLQTFDSYPGAQELVQTLVAHGVRAQSLSIVGSDVAVVERVLATVGYGRTALSSALSGSWLGVLAGLVFVVISPTDLVTPIVSGLLIGAGVGMVVGMALFSSSRGLKRRYRSSQQIIAQKYRVMVEPTDSDSAKKALKDHAAHDGD